MIKKTLLALAALAVLAGCAGKTINQVYDYAGWENEKTCRTNIGALASALRIYASDYDDELPEADWATVLKPYAKSESFYTCPALYEPGTALAGYSFNASLYGVSQSTIPDPDAVVAFYESTAMTKGHAGNPADMLTTSRHAGSIYRIYLSGYLEDVEALP